MSDVSAPTRDDLLRTVAEGTAGIVGEAYLEHLVRRIGEAFGAGVCWVAEILEPERSARALASWPSDALPRGQEYLLAGTPCRRIYADDVVSVTAQVSDAYPEDPFLARHGLSG